MVYKPTYNWGAPSCIDILHLCKVLVSTIVKGYGSKSGNWVRVPLIIRWY